MMWVLVINGLIYLGFIYLHGEWRDVVPRKSFPRDAWAMLTYYLFIRERHPVQGKYNALQRGTYFILPIIGAVAVITGIAIWKPVQLQWLTDLMGGYAWARYWHFMAMVVLVALSMIHIFMVFTVDPQALKSITIGGYDESKSPEARNARPFYHLFRRPEPDAATIAAHPSLTPTDSFETARRPVQGRHSGAEAVTIDRRKFIIVSSSAVSSALIAACDSRGPKAPRNSFVMPSGRTRLLSVRC
jgi:hypothetical protein